MFPMCCLDCLLTCSGQYQRSKAFIALKVAYLSGLLMTPALGGFIANLA